MGTFVSRRMNWIRHHRASQAAMAVVTASCLAGSAVSFAAVATAGAAARAGTAPTITHAARIPYQGQTPNGGGIRNTWSASNWSGYAEAGTFTGVTGTWTVPAVAASSTATYSAAWIGVDGFNDSDLIQTGTEEDYYNGAAHYSAWWEILPAAETSISSGAYPVAPGDRMSASIDETAATVSTGRGRQSTTEHVWAIAIKDTTKGWTFSTDQAYGGPGSSAEWVVEAPEVNGRIATLAHYTINAPSGTGDFDGAGILTGIVSSGAPVYKAAGLNYQNDSGVMVQNGAPVSTPGDPDSALTAFDAAYGATVPPTPAG